MPRKAQLHAPERVRKIPVVKGLVYCPLRGCTDVEDCFYCPWTLTIDLDSPAPRIRCAPDVQTAPVASVKDEDRALMQLAAKIGNVSEACRRQGVSRMTFYRIKRRCQGPSANPDPSSVRKSSV
jgi:hypothetical protein